MTWTGFTIQGKRKDLTHLQGFDLDVEVDGQPLKLLVTFGSHCFTDEKENGPMLFKEGRYWSEERYQCSLQLFMLNSRCRCMVSPFIGAFFWIEKQQKPV